MRKVSLSVTFVVLFLLQSFFATASPQPSGRIWVLPYFVNGRGVIAIQNTSVASSNLYITPLLDIRPADKSEKSGVKLSWLDSNKKKMWAVAAEQTKTFVLTVEGAKPGKTYIVSRRSADSTVDIGNVLTIPGRISVIPDSLNDSNSACVDHGRSHRVEVLIYRSSLFHWVKAKKGSCQSLATGLYRELKPNGSTGHFTPMKDAVPLTAPQLDRLTSDPESPS